MKQLLLLFACWGVLSTSAQTRYSVDLSAQAYTTPWAPGRISAVLDARADRTSIGWVQKGLNNTRVPAELSQPLEPALLRLLHTLPGSSGATTAYVLRVHQLEIGEITTASNEMASAELVADFLRPRPDGQYDLLWRAAEATSNRGLDVTGRHPANIAAVLRACLAQFEAAGPATLPVAAVLSAAQAAAPEPKLAPLTPYPLLAESVRRAGAYQSFDEFRRNAPGGKRVVVISKKPRSRGEWAGIDDVDLEYVGDRGQKWPVRDVWCYCDGQDLYILYQRRFHLLTRTSEGFSFEAPSAPEAGDVAAGAVLGGAIGGAIAAAASGGHRQLHTLNMLTGRITALPVEVGDAAFGDDEAAQPGQVLVYRRKVGPGSAEVYAGEKRVGTLDAETSSLTIPWADKRQQLKLCVRLAGAPETCAELLPRTGETLYLEWAGGAGSAALKPVSAKEGAFEVRRAELRTRQKQAAD